MSSSEDLATPCLQPCTPALPDGSGHNTASCHLLPAQGRPLPPPGHSLIVSQKCPQPLLSMSSWALLPGVGAGPHRAQMWPNMLLQWTLLLYANSTSVSQSAQLSCCWLTNTQR